MNKKVVILGILTVLLSITIAVGFSYAVWTQTKEQEIANTFSVGCFNIEISEQENAIDLNNDYPITDEDGMKRVPFTFTVTNTCDYYGNYAVNLEKLATSNMDSKFIKVMLDNNKPDFYNKYPNGEVQSKDTNEVRILYTGGVAPKKSVTHSLRIWIDYNATVNDVGGKTFNSKIVVTSVAVNTYCDENPDAVICKNQSQLAFDDLGLNLRYIGATPNNYVKFNGELWRIIGVFNNMYECPEDIENEKIDISNYTTKCSQTKLLKIVRDQSIGEYSWDSTELGINSSYGINEWSTSAISKALNEAYYNSTNGICYGNGNKELKDCDFFQGSIKGLDEKARNQVARVMWNTGTVDGTTTTIDNTNTKEMYTAERSDNNGKSLCTNSEKSCNDQISRTTKWIGKVGLMYPSDYGYATSGGNSINREQCLSYQLYSWNYKKDCAQNSWLFNSANQWTMTPAPHSSYAFAVFYVHGSGLVYDYGANYPHGVRPVVYLKSDVKILDDDMDGSSSKPYNLSY